MSAFSPTSASMEPVAIFLASSDVSVRQDMSWTEVAVTAQVT